MDNCNLTEKEKIICEKIIEGKTNKEISEELFLSVNTVRTHINNILKKTSAKSKLQLALLWIKTEKYDI